MKIIDVKKNQYTVCFKMMSHIIFLLHECLCLIKVKGYGEYIIYQGIQKTDGNTLFPWIKQNFQYFTVYTY